MSLNTRSPYLIQVGFDFGTSFSKCVLRDLSKDKAWVFQSSKYRNGMLPFLIPSSVEYEHNIFRRHIDTSIAYTKNGLHHIKFAVERFAAGDYDSPVLDVYKQKANSAIPSKYGSLIIKSAIFFLATTFGDIIFQVTNKFLDFGSNCDDQFFINMAIPVADACDLRISDFYLWILKRAWISAPHFIDADNIDSEKLVHLVTKAYSAAESNQLDNACFLYPEVSANVQALIRSPAFSPCDTTIYFISDTGSGTVDQSVFTYPRSGNNKLNYFAASVIPCGSSNIERIASSDKSITELEFWRKEKEAGRKRSQLLDAQRQLQMELSRATKKSTIDTLLTKLPHGPGIDPISTLSDNLRLVFCGGGHTKEPYEAGVTDAFAQVLGREAPKPTISSMQVPPDLDISNGNPSWMHRLYVAYGLSFSRVDLVESLYPSEIDSFHISSASTPHRKTCSCRGRNPSCQHCFGRGWIGDD